MIATLKVLVTLSLLPFAFGAALVPRADDCEAKPFTVKNFIRTTTVTGKRNIIFDLYSASAGTTPHASCSGSAEQLLLEDFGNCDDGTFYEFVGDTLLVNVPRICDGYD